MVSTFLILLSVFAVSSLSLIGLLFLTFKITDLNRLSTLLVGFAIGALFGDAFIHLLPETVEKLGLNSFTGLYFIAGILLFFVIEKYLHWRHCHSQDCREHSHPVIAVNIIGDIAHNTIDGMVIAASYLVSIPLGIATTLAIILHEIPHEIGNFGVLVSQGLTPRRAIILNVYAALASFVGALIIIFVGSQFLNLTLILLPLTAGGFIYVACADLIPQLHQETHPGTSLLQMLSILVGVGLMFLLTYIG